MKTGKVKGFSIEGYFADRLESKPKAELSADENKIEELKKLLRWQEQFIAIAKTPTPLKNVTVIDAKIEKSGGKE